MTEYRRKFIETAAPLDPVAEEILLGQFLKGLKEDIRAEVRLLSPVSLEQAMELALRVEEKNTTLGPKKNMSSSFKSSMYSYALKGPAGMASVSGADQPHVS